MRDMSLHIFLNTKLRLNMYFLDITHLLKIELEVHTVSRSVYNNRLYVPCHVYE